MRYEIKTIKQLTTKTGKPYKIAELYDVDSDKVLTGIKIWSSFANFANLTEGSFTEGIIEDGVLTMVHTSKARSYSNGAVKSAMMSEMVEKKQEGIREAQDFKSEGIKVSATARDATLILVALMQGKQMDTVEWRREWQSIRKWLVEHWDDLDASMPLI